MAAKYDGVDLPDNMCRILIIDSLPITDTITEKYIECCIPNSTFTQIKTAQTIEQGLGRAVRGEKDYCVVLLLGNELVKQIRFKGSRPYLSPQTRKQIDIGLDLAKYAREDMDESGNYTQMLISIINQGLGRNENLIELIKNHSLDNGVADILEVCLSFSPEDRIQRGARVRSCFLPTKGPLLAGFGNWHK